jgi:hypothetical protein
MPSPKTGHEERVLKGCKLKTEDKKWHRIPTTSSCIYLDAHNFRNKVGQFVLMDVLGLYTNVSSRFRPAC